MQAWHQNTWLKSTISMQTALIVEHILPAFHSDALPLPLEYEKYGNLHTIDTYSIKKQLDLSHYSGSTMQHTYIQTGSMKHILIIVRRNQIPVTSQLELWQCFWGSNYDPRSSCNDDENYTPIFAQLSFFPSPELTLKTMLFNLNYDPNTQNSHNSNNT